MLSPAITAQHTEGTEPGKYVRNQQAHRYKALKGALRPGIHAVDIPSMKHIGEKANGSQKINSRRADQRWFLIEYPVDVDYNQEAYQHKTKDIREHLPTDGWYSFQTNSGAEARQHWFITGAMKIVGAVSEQDVRAYAREHGFEEDLPWLNGKSYDESKAIDLQEYMRTMKAEPTPSKDEMRQRILDERKTAAREGRLVQLSERDAKKFEGRYLSSVTRDEVYDCIKETRVKGVYTEADYIPFRASTPPIFCYFVKCQQLPMVAPANKIRDAQKPDTGYKKGQPRYHGFTAEQILEIIERMGDPQYIIFEPPQEANHYIGRYGEVVELVGEDDDAITFVDVSCTANPDRLLGFKDKVFDVQVTEFKVDGGPEGLEAYFKKNSIQVLYDKDNYDIENEGDLARKLPADIPFAVKQDTLNIRLSSNGENVKQGFQEFQELTSEETLESKEEDYGFPEWLALDEENADDSQPQLSSRDEIENLEKEINAAGLRLTSKENNKNNQRINAYIAEKHPELVGRVRFTNDKTTGTVKITEIRTPEEIERIRKREAEEFQSRRNREAFWNRYHTQASIARLEDQVRRMLKRNGYDADVEHSRSSVGSLSFYVKTDDGKTIKISDHNTIRQELSYQDTAFINLHEIESLDMLYQRIKSAIDGVQQPAVAQFHTQWSMRDSTVGDTREETAARVRSYNQLQADNAALQRQVERLKKQLKPTQERTVRHPDAVKLAKELLNGIRAERTDVDAKELTEVLERIGNYLVETPTDELDYDVMQRWAYEIARDIIQTAEDTVSNGMEEIGRTLKDYLQGQRLKIDKADVHDLGAESLTAWKKLNPGIRVSTKDGLSVDTAYQELQEQIAQESAGKSCFLPRSRTGSNNERAKSVTDIKKKSRNSQCFCS